MRYVHESIKTGIKHVDRNIIEAHKELDKQLQTALDIYIGRVEDRIIEDKIHRFDDLILNYNLAVIDATRAFLEQRKRIE